MDENDIIKKLQAAGLHETGFSRNMAGARRKLTFAGAQKKPLLFKLSPALIFVAAVAAAGFYMSVESGGKAGAVNDLGGLWCTYDDRNDSGSSVVWPPASESGENTFIKSSPGSTGAGYAVRITGTTGSGKESNFIGFTTFLSPYSSCPECAGIDLTRFKGIRFNIKGQTANGRLKLIIPHEAKPSDGAKGICKSLTSSFEYEIDITGLVGKSWKRISLEFRKSFGQPEGTGAENVVDIRTVLADANVIKWHFYSGEGGTADIWIDKLEFY